MNKEDYVSLEMAKLLKEKGFNEYCGAYYHLNWEDMTEEERFEAAPSHDFRNKDNGYRVGAPTLYEAAKWLREVHNIHVMIGVDDLGWWYQLYDCSEDGRMEETNNFSGSVACQKSYEEALNNGIFDALKLI